MQLILPIVNRKTGMLHCFSYKVCLPPTKINMSIQYKEEIYFFEVNANYISSSVLSTSEFSRVRSTSETFDVFNSRDDIYWVFTEKQIFLI